jgi:hypothetical protein
MNFSLLGNVWIIRPSSYTETIHGMEVVTMAPR